MHRNAECLNVAFNDFLWRHYQRLLTFNKLNNFDGLLIFVDLDWNLVQFGQVVPLRHDVVRGQKILEKNQKSFTIPTWTMAETF